MGIFRSKFFRFLLVGIIFLLSATGFAVAQESDVIHIQEQWRTFFSDQEAVLHLNIPSSESLSSNGIWTLSYNNRTLSQGTFVINQSTSAGSQAKLSVRIPPVKEGIMISAELRIEIPRLNDQENSLQMRENVFIFPKDLFTANQQQLSEAKIGLFDPQEKTGPMFKQLDLPYEEYLNMDAVTTFQGGLFIVGEGVDFKLYSALWPELLGLAERGVPVLVLAPQSGEFNVPTLAGTETRQLEKMILAREAVIKEFNKNFDTYWAPQGRTTVIGFKPASSEGEFSFVADSSQEGWPWLELIFASPGAKMIVCGFDLTGAMEQSPTPRYFLADIIQTMIQP